MACDGIDPASLQLILELQLSDAERLLKGKSREGETPDVELAAGLYKSELESMARLNSDRTMCRSITRAVQLDADTIRSHAEQESQAVRDRQQALGQNQPTETQDNAIPKLDDEMLSRLEAMSVFDDDESILVGDNGESSSWAASRPTTSIPRRRCIACGDGLMPGKEVNCPCSHDYCVGCLESLVSTAITDESLFPPRCCKQPIPMQVIETLFTSAFVLEFRAKEVEYGTSNRTYCHVATCSAFINPSFIEGDTATCSQCSAQTCSMCKGPSHKSDCPEDETTQEVLRIAAENGWQRCQTCHRMVELDTGCNHMTCLCGAQFCYVCGVQWKNCGCAQWEENRLFARANVIVNRNNQDGPVDAARRDVLVERERQNLIENHECSHERWRSRQGSYECEECLDVLPQYIYECRQCRILACRRCRFNRL